MKNKPKLPTADQEVIAKNPQVWYDWLEANPSFRYEPLNGELPYTARKEQGKGLKSYWYAYRKASGKLAKVYVGESPALTVDRLEEVAVQLSQKLPTVTESAVTETVTDNSSETIAQLQSEIERLQTELQIALGK